jgi:microcystin-dependent protein
MIIEGYLGEIRIIAADAIPQNWLPCDGRTIRIRDNTALFSLLGTMYGGDGTNTFALPDLRARVPIGVGEERWQGERAAAASTKGTPAEQPFLALNFCICNAYGVFPPRA